MDRTWICNSMVDYTSWTYFSFSRKNLTPSTMTTDLEKNLASLVETCTLFFKRDLSDKEIILQIQMELVTTLVESTGANGPESLDMCTKVASVALFSLAKRSLEDRSSSFSE